MLRRALPLAVALAIGCSPPQADEPPAPSVWSDAVVALDFEVDYATGAEPFSAEKPGLPGPSHGRGFGLLESNLARLFAAHPKEIVVPGELADMEQLLDVAGDTFTQADVLEVAARHRGLVPSADRAALYLVWLPGYFHDGTSRREDVLGASFGSTGVIGMFYPVIAAEMATATLPLELARLVEQATLTHEVAHALGLVDRGVAMVTPHRDADHGRHCTASSCLMHYTLESVTTVRAFLESVHADGTTVLFDAACLADADAAE